MASIFSTAWESQHHKGKSTIPGFNDIAWKVAMALFDHVQDISTSLQAEKQSQHLII